MLAAAVVELLRLAALAIASTAVLVAALAVVVALAVLAEVAIRRATPLSPQPPRASQRLLQTR